MLQQIKALTSPTNIRLGRQLGEQKHSSLSIKIKITEK